MLSFKENRKPKRDQKREDKLEAKSMALKERKPAWIDKNV